ncbi:uncharacterized protein B0P05DRAFT_547526 [Gilbertella persicaria]|uniref:uncharacterized protein n=1 Tax=Gilbertella persicaria TaxID=101096 RepID=UPI00221E7273|nr:uncharacterized protein B0P05DRAFT_547526 [Gilbertella persicaria]KAI8075440.1 hypothetical protein B0P05DRAFT_547526 [Gilbertella persicaria]
MKIAFLIPFVTFALAIINNTDDSLDGHGDVGFTPLIAFDTIPTGTPEHDKKKIFGTVWETIEQKLGSNLTKEEKEEVPNQMAPIEKALLIIRPKISERWVAREESIIKWAISNYLVSKANRIYMNCDLYLGKKMIMSVFKDVPFNIGTERYTQISVVSY